MYSAVLENGSYIVKEISLPILGVDIFHSKQKCQDYCDQKNHDKWWKCMLIPLKDIPQGDLEWAALKCNKFNSYYSKKVFLQEIERRNNETN